MIWNHVLHSTNPDLIVCYSNYGQVFIGELRAPAPSKWQGLRFCFAKACYGPTRTTIPGALAAYQWSKTPRCPASTITTAAADITPITINAIIAKATALAAPILILIFGVSYLDNLILIQYGLSYTIGYDGKNSKKTLMVFS